MTQEDKELVLKDLCTRLPYDVYIFCKLKKVAPDGTTGAIFTLDSKFLDDMYNTDCSDVPFDEFMPYLRPMSSMTEEEKKEYASLIQNVHWTMVGLEARGILSIDLAECKDDNEGSIENIYNIIPLNPIDWLNAHHFDYRGLISKGLAITAPKGMYK